MKESRTPRSIDIIQLIDVRTSGHFLHHNQLTLNKIHRYVDHIYFYVIVEVKIAVNRYHRHYHLHISSASVQL